MRETPNTDIEKFRVLIGPLASIPDSGNNGAFLISTNRVDRKLACIVSDDGGWEHVSVHVEVAGEDNEIPTWGDMCRVKSLFWRDDECVIQYHPPASRYVNRHPCVLHLWKPTGIEIAMPPPIFV
jgi:hypothetical protein